MPFADTLGEERVASTYFMQRLGAVRRAQQLPASAQFDLARSPISDDELEDLIDSFRDTPAARSGWGFSELLQQVLSSEPKRLPVSDLTALQTNLIAGGYAPPNAVANGNWDPSWFASFRRWDRDNWEQQQAGRHWYSAPIESGIRAITNTLPSRVFQGLVGGAIGVVKQTPETFERGGLVGGGVAGAGIGAAVGSLAGPGGALVGAGVGAVAGGVAGFLSDLLGSDEGEEDQSGAERLLDALTPYDEYKQQGARAFFEDVGYVASAASMITGAGIAARGVSTGVRALSAARALPEVGAVMDTSAVGAALQGAPGELASFSGGGAVLGQPASVAAAALFRPAARSQLGIFGTLVKAAARRGQLLPGTVGALENTMLRWSPISFGQRLGPNIALKAFGGLTQAQMGARLFGGMGQGSSGEFEEAKTALEAKLGRDLNEGELARISRLTATSTIEKAIASAPELKTGIRTPLGDLVDLSAFVLYPQHFLPFRGASVAKSSVAMLGDTMLAPLAHAAQHDNPGLGIKRAVEFIKEKITPIDNAWLRADYGINREADDIIQRARLSPEKAYRQNSHQYARADVIRNIRREYDVKGRSETLERVMEYSIVDPTDFEGWLIRLNGKHRGVDRLTAWKKANELARKTEREVTDQFEYIDTDSGVIVRANASLPDEELRLAGAEGGVMLRPGQRKPVSTKGIASVKQAENVDILTVEDRIARLETRAKKYVQTADRATVPPWVGISLREQARLARSEAQGLRDKLKILKGGNRKFPVIDRFRIAPARTEFADRATVFAKRREFLQLRQEVLATLENPNAHLIARQKFDTFVDQLSMEGFIPDAIAKKSKVGKPSDRIAKILEEQAKSAARTVDLPDQYMKQFEELGYKPVETGDDVLFPDQLEQMIEVGGIGDYTRRAQVWETLALSPRWRSDRSLFRLRREHELSELAQVFAEEKILLSPEQAMRRLHERLSSINHGGAVLGPFVRSEGKTRLYKVDTRDLSVDDILKAFEDVPGFTDKTALKMYGALRRGAAYGGELKFLAPMDSARAIGKALRINGLPGFSDVIRTWHAEAPLRLNRARAAWKSERFTYRPEADLARSSERARIEGGLRNVAAKSKVTEQQRQFGMMLLDSTVRGQVKLGRFTSVDHAYRALSVGYAERFIPGPGDTLLKRVAEAPSFGDLKALAKSGRESKGWYERSARALADAIPPGKVQLGDGSYVENFDLFTQVLAATSPLSDPGDNLSAALGVMQMHLNGSAEWPKGLLPSMKGMLEDIFSGKVIGSWGEKRAKKVSAFYRNLMGEADKVTVDTWMARLYGHEGLSANQSDEIANSIRSLANDLDWKPMQVQAALWRGVKEDTADSYLREAAAAALAGDSKQAGTLRRVAAQIKDSRSFEDYLKTPKIQEKLDSLNWHALLQKVEDDVLGFTEFGPDFPVVMRFFRNADFSTLVHENAHLLRRLLPDGDVQILEHAYGVGALKRVAFKPTAVKPLGNDVDTILRRTLDEGPGGGGVTYDPHTGRFVEGGTEGAGAAVATESGTAREVNAARAASDPEWFRGELEALIRDNRKVLENPRAHIGTWNDREGTIHLDVSEILPREEAQMAGALRKQKAVFDLETLEDIPATFWTRAQEERFAEDAEKYILRKIDPSHSGLQFKAIREAVGRLWGQTRGVAYDRNLVPGDVRKVLDETFGDVFKVVPPSRTKAALAAGRSKQIVGGALLGAGLGAVEGDEKFEDALRGAALGAAGGLMTRAALGRTYGYLPDFLTRLNTALRYTLSFTFDAGRYTEQNMIAMTKHGLPPMLAPQKYIRSREWKTPFRNGTVRGDDAWTDAIRLWDELNGTTWFQNIDDLDRRMFQSGMLGFSPRNWEAAQAFQLYQRGMPADEIRKAITEIGRYGLGRTAAEKSANFVVFPFSFSKKYLTTLGDFILQAPGRNLLIHEGLRRYHESSMDEGFADLIDKHLPILKQLAKVNNLVYGISPGRFFLSGLDDHRSGIGKAMQLIASVMVPSGAATPLAQAAGGVGDLAVNAFVPLVITGESLGRAGGVDGFDDILRRYIPFVREVDQYFIQEGAAVSSQIKAITEGADPYYQFSKYQDGLRLVKSELEPVALALGYSSVDGLLGSNLGPAFGAKLDAEKQGLSEQYPTGFMMSQTFENTDAVNERALLDLAAKSNRSEAEDEILQLSEEADRLAILKDVVGLPAEIVDAIIARNIRTKALEWVGDRRFSELYDRFFARIYGPIRRVA